MSPALGWFVLSLVFLDEFLAAVAAGVAGAHYWGLPGAVLAPAVVVSVWWTFASPRAPLGRPVVRPLVKAAVFGLASFGLWASGHRAWAVALLVFSLVVNAAAQAPSVRTLVDQPARH